jgi:DNA-binding transcriptional ArsR family regulator
MSIDVQAAGAAFTLAAVPVLKALAEPLRWRIVAALAAEELCVCHLTEDLGAPQPLISHHLRVLREAGVIESERWRYWTYYRLRSDALAELASVLDALAAAPTGAAEQRRPCC